MQGIKVSITSWLDDHQPGWVECELRDYAGVVHVFREKAPVVSSMVLGRDSHFPLPGVIACSVAGRRSTDGREVVSVSTRLPWGVESTTGRSQFDVDSRCLVDVVADDAEALT